MIPVLSYVLYLIRPTETPKGSVADLTILRGRS